MRILNLIFVFFFRVYFGMVNFSRLLNFVTYVYVDVNGTGYLILWKPKIEHNQPRLYLPSRGWFFSHNFSLSKTILHLII